MAAYVRVGTGNVYVDLGVLRSFVEEATALGMADDSPVKDRQGNPIIDITVTADFDASMARAHYKPELRSV